MSREEDDMKKNKIMIFVLIALLIISAISVWQNVKAASRLERLRKSMINQAYAEFTIISYNLDGVLRNIESGATDFEQNRQSLSALSHRFTSLHTLLKWYATGFPPKGMGRNGYAGASDFEFISYTLIDGSSSVNTKEYSGIVADGAISEKEILYLTILRDDIDVIIASMVSPDNPPQEDKNLTTERIDRILDTFFSKWSFHEENSPFLLLLSE
jgi:hypothetical protein